MIILGKHTDDKGTQLEALTRSLLEGMKQTEEYLDETSLRSLRTKPVQVALTDLIREQVSEQWTYKGHKVTSAAKAP